LRIIFAGGGTAGHINPALAIARHFQRKHPDSEILFIGTRKGLETGLVPREGFRLEFITVRGFRRKLSLSNLTAVKELGQGILQARRIIRQFKPDLVIGTGGYVCGPVLFVASRMHIPTLIHEQNAFPGVTNKLLARFVDAVAISFKESAKYFTSATRLVHTGNPIRMELFDTDRASARNRLGIDRDKPLVVFSAGSRGAGKINDAIVDMLKNYYKKGDFQIICSTGEANYEEIKQKLEGSVFPSVNIVPYIYDAAGVYNAADLMVCRAGAITTSELTVLGLPSVLVPSPNVTANHQEYNARALERDGAAVVILDKDLTGKLLYQQINGLLKDRDQLSKMSKNAKKIGISNAVDRIYSLAREIMINTGNR